MTVASIKVIVLAMIIGILPLTKPYTSHISVPNVNSEYITDDMDVVSFVLMVLIAWSIKEAVVQAAAIIPIPIMQLIAFRNYKEQWFIIRNSTVSSYGDYMF